MNQVVNLKTVLKISFPVLALFLAMAGSISLASSAPVITVTKTDALIVDNGTSGEADPGDTIRYTVKIQNTGDMNANNVVFDDTIDGNTTLSGVAHVSPLAFADSYDSLGNVGLDVPAGNGLLLNDADPDATVANSVVEVNGVPGNVGVSTATTQGGTVTVQSNGAFVYNPPAGFEGDDTFTYTLSDGDPITPNDTETVTITVNEVIWFIDGTQGSQGTGTLNSPFNSVDGTGFTTASDSAGDTIYMFDVSGTSDYTGSITLKDNQILMGEGSTASIPAATGITVPPFSKTLVVPVGTLTTRPTLNTVGGTAITLANNNTIRGIAVGTGGTSGTAISGTNAGNINVLDTSVTVGATGLDIIYNGSNTGSVNVNNSNFSKSGSGGTDMINIITQGSSNVDIDIKSSSFTTTSAIGAIDLESNDSSTMIFEVSNNPTIQANNSSAIIARALQDSIMQGRVENNPAISLTAGTPGQGVFAGADDTADVIVVVNGNTITLGSDIGGGVRIAADDNNGAATMHATVNNNTITINTNPGFGRGIQLVDDGAATLCANITNNNVVDSAVLPGPDIGISIVDDSTTAGPALQLQSLVGGPFNGGGGTLGLVDAWWTAGGNTDNADAGSTFVQNDVAAGTCLTPTLVSAPTLAPMLVEMPNMTVAEVKALQTLMDGETTALALAEAEPAISVSGRSQGLASFAQAGENINQSIGTMEPGQMVWVIWDVTVDDPLNNPGNTNICNQATVTAAGGIDVDSDDPDTGAASDPTCTPIGVAPGTVVIVKDSIPDDAQDFSFTSTGGLPTASFTLDDDADGTLLNTETINSVTPGSYTVTESSVPGWANTAITCVDGAGSTVASTADVTSRTATINVEAGETVTCTFQNRPTSLVINEVDYDQPTPPTSDSAEFIEIKNTGPTPVQLGGHFIQLINGFTGTVYDTIPLPITNLAPGGYFVICSSAANVDNCDLVDTPSTNWIQNGSPDAIALLFGNALVDTVSYEGNTAAPYTETAGAPADLGTAGNDDEGLSRFSDGTDTDNNSADFSVRCITPGEANVAASSDCRPQGTITIIKDTVPNDGEDFTFTTTGGLPLATFDLDDDGTPALANNISFNGVDAGSYTVTEAATPGYVTTLVCVDPDGGTTISGATATIDLDDGETVTCTYTNTLNSGTITIIKDTVPNDGQDFTFNTTGGLPLATFDLDDDGTATLANNISFNTVDAGSYTVTEVATAGYDTALVCVDPDGGTTISDATANIDLDAGETVVCTYTNTRAVGTVTIIKDTVPNDGQDFTFNTTGGLPLATFDLDDDGTATLANNISFNSIEAGSYTVTEVATPGYDTTLVCVDPDGGTTTSGATANIDLDTGETVTCTFTNRREVVDLELSKSDGGITAEPGDTVVYTIIYENKLGFDTATNVILTETVPPNTTFNATASTGVWSCADGSPAGTICTQAVGNLLSNSTSSSTTFAVDVDNPFSATGGVQILNTATISSDQSDADPSNNTVFEATPITAAPELAITKSDGGGTFAGGDTIVYSIDVSNTGNRIAPSVIISETVPAHTSFNAGASSAGWTCSPAAGPAGANCTLQIPLLDNTPQTILFAVNLVNPLPIGVTSTDNHVDIRSSSQFPEANTDNNEFQLTTQLDNTSSITIIKDVIYVADIDVDSDRDFGFFSTELGNFFLDDPLIDDTDGITEEIVFMDQVPGDYTIIEGPNGNWIQSVLCVGDDNIIYLGPDIGVTIDLDAGEDVVCTFTNERVTYELTYTKVVSPGTPIPPTDWEFTLASLLNLVPGDIDIDFGVVTTATAAGGASDSLTLPLAAYKVGEVVPGNYELVRIDCGPGGLSTSPPVNDQFTIILDQNLNCTFTNETTKAEITLNKIVIKDHGGTAGVNDFGLSIGGTPVNSGQTILVTAEQPITIDEVGLAGYQFVSITGHPKCPALLGGSMIPDRAEQISCTITNDDKPGQLTIIKNTVPDDPQDFSFSVTGGLVPANFQLDDDADGTLVNNLTYAGIPTGIYQITEAPVVGFDTFINCVDATGDTTVLNNTATAHVALGEIVTCTFTNEKQIPEISIDDVSIVEGTGGTTTMEFTVVRTNNYFATSVIANSVDGTADSPADYGPIINEVVNFTPGGSLSKVVSVDIVTDAIVEADETFFINLSNAVNGNIVDAQGEGTIENDDKATLKLSGGTSRTETDSGQVEYIFYAILYDPVQGGFTLDLATLDLTATVADNDYEANSETLTFVGDVDERHTFKVYVNGDKKVEPDESFGAQITSGPTTPVASVADSIMVTTEVGRFDLDFHTAKIFNDDSARVTLTGAETVIEGDSGNTFVKYTATLDNPVVGGFKVKFSTLSGSASNTSDFVDNDQTLTFSGTAGEEKSVTVRVTGDELVEADETFYVSLNDFTSTPFGGDLSVAGSPKIVTIENDDVATATLSGNAAVLEGDSGTTAYTFEATLDADVDGGFDIVYSIDDGTATTADGDYQDAAGTLRFSGNKGETQTITVLVNGDVVGEAHETFKVVLRGVTPDKSGITINKAQSPFVATITNDDNAVFFIDVANIKVSEGAGSIPFEVTLSNTVATTTTVEYQTSDGSAIDGVDYTGVSGTLTFAPGEGVKIVDIPILNDNIDEENESIVVTLSNSTGAGFGNPSVVELVIIDDDQTPEINIDGSPLKVSESVSSLTVVVSLSGPSSSTVEVDINSADGSATAGSDYTAVAQTLTFAPGETTKTISLPILSDAIYEGDETLTLSLSNPDNANLGVEATEVVTILEDSAVPGMSIASVSMLEPESGEAKMNFEVVLSKAVAVDIAVDFTTVDGTAVAGEDYIASSGTLIIQAGSTKGTISVTVLADSDQEGDETFSLILSNPSGAELDPTAATGVTGVIKTSGSRIFLPVVTR